MAADWKLTLIASGLGALVIGCTMDQSLRVPADAPPAFENQSIRTAAWPSKEWYRDFSSRQLNGLMDQAASGNWDLVAARARIAQADARARQAGAAIFPSVEAGGNASFLTGHSSSGSGHETDWSALLSASYEVDFWGKNRAAANSASFLATASRAERDTLALSTLAGVADGYFTVLALRERLAFARSDVDAARSLLDAVQARYKAGSASPLELATQTSAVNAAALVIPQLQQTESEALTALALLVGSTPEGFAIQTEALDSLTEPRVAPGLPAELLTRRPDLLVAEANLRSANADLAVARAAMLPSLNLTAAGGVQNPALNAAILAIPGTGPGLTLTGSLTQVIFDHGRLQAQRAEVQAKNAELLAAYRSAIVAALSDVENALSAIRHLEEARQFQTDLLTQAERAFEGAKLRYQAGATDYLTLLEAQRSLYAGRDQFVQYKLARLQALVGLCKALGGGWSQTTTLPAVATQAAAIRPDQTAARASTAPLIGTAY